jgi:murein DD-endopeptidase MepM/ murein hydrolase activator NlpD
MKKNMKKVLNSGEGICKTPGTKKTGKNLFFPSFTAALFILVLFFSPYFGIGAQEARKSQPRFALIPDKPRPGDPVSVGFFSGAPDTPDTLTASLINSQGQRLARAVFFKLAESGGSPVKAALLAIPSTARSGSARIRIDGASGTIGEIPFTIRERDFLSEEIFLDQANTELRTQQDPEKIAESKILWAILSHTGSEIFASGPFVPPVSSTRRTSFFGDRRIFRYFDGSKETSIHAGVDYGVPRGTPVTACAPGKVVLARFRIVTGNSVILEHMPGVYSLYYHLDKIAVAEETMAQAGTLLGESGSTGLSTGPHLHWEIRIAGENADPDVFTARSVLDKDVLLGKIIP